MAKKSQPFVIATEGKTVDGRHVSREWLTQMAANYNPAAYTAVVNLEHLLSLAPDSIFSAHGKVVALSTKEADIFGEKKLQLTAVVEVNDKAVEMQQEGKKCFASMEVIPNFANGQAYLTGLALTDTPACLGTEPMRFSQFSNGKTDDIFAFAGETTVDFSDKAPGVASAAPQPSEGETLFAKIKTLLTGEGKDTKFSDISHAVETIALSQKALIERQASTELALKLALEARTQSLDALKADFAAMKTALEKTAAPFTPTPPAPGGNGAVKTDC